MPQDTEEEEKEVKKMENIEKREEAEEKKEEKEEKEEEGKGDEGRSEKRRITVAIARIQRGGKAGGMEIRAPQGEGARPGTGRAVIVATPGKKVGEEGAGGGGRGQKEMRNEM